MGRNERLQYIDERIREKGAIRVQEIAQKFEVSPRTIKRDIEYLRNTLNAPLVYDSRKKGYTYSLPFEYFTHRSEKMLLFYVFLLGLLESPTHFPFIEKYVISKLKETINDSYLSLIPRITYQMQEWEELNIELFSKLIAAIRNEYLLRITYQDAKGKITQRKISPQHFIHYEGRWYCIAFDEQKKALRVFLLSRIIECEIDYTKPSKKNQL